MVGENRRHGTPPVAATPLLEFRRERTSGNPPFGWLSARGYNPRALAFRRKTKAPKTKARRIKKLRLLALLGVLTLLTTASFLFGLLTAISSEISALDPANRHEELNGVIYANDGHSVLAVLRGSESRVLVPSSQISPWMKNAIVAIEDRRFYEHRGIDLRGMARALWSDIQQKKVVEGGSTITQQFVKNAYVTNKRSIGRKIREAALAWQLEQQRSKDWILAAYLNTIYFANGAYGVQQASRIYFDKSAKDLTVWEAALLAGIPGDPTLYDPVAHPQSALERRNLVLKDLLDEKYLSDGQYDARAGAPASPRRPGAPARHPGPGTVLRELREGPARAPLRRETCLRRRVRGADDDRPRPPADRARLDLEVAGERGGPDGGARRGQPAGRQRARDGRR